MDTKSEITDDRKLIGRRLQQARLDNGWSIERLAAEMQLSVATVRRYEKGEKGGHPPYVAVVRAAHGLGLPVDWFAEPEGEAS